MNGTDHQLVSDFLLELGEWQWDEISGTLLHGQKARKCSSMSTQENNNGNPDHEENDNGDDSW